MEKRVWTFLPVVLCVLNVARSEDAHYRDIYPDTWVATDAHPGFCSN